MNKTLNRAVRAYFIGFLIWFFVLFLILIRVPTEQLFVWINHPRHLIADLWWTFFTALGDGIAIVSLAVLLGLWRKKLLALGILGSYLLSGLVVRIVKNIINMPRPANYFEGITEVYTASWFTLHFHQSMPSGHTTSAFAAITVLVLGMNNKKYTLALLLVACLIGYSRVYLGQHFVQDIWIGSYIGVVCGIIIFRVLNYFTIFRQLM